MKKCLQSMSMVALCVVAALTSGCAFGTRRATLGYAASSPSSAVAHAKPTAPRIALVKFVDQRADKRAIGEVRNGWGMHTADVVAETDVADWVTRAVATELENAGYQLTLGNEGAVAPETTILTGDIVTVYCTALFSYEGEVSFFARVMQDGHEVLAKRYTGKGSAGLNWGATASGYAESLSVALANATKELVSDLHAVTAQSHG
jgi:hypothetical protein